MTLSRSTPSVSSTMPAKLPAGSRATVPRGPLCIVVNGGSGHDAAGARLVALRELLVASGLQYRFFEVRKPSQLPAIAQRAREAAEAEDGVIVAAGGDGTLNAVVQSARHSTQPFAILPQGTFNYFGRDLGVSADLAESVPGLKDAELVDVQFGLVNEHAFLVNASLGLYPELLEQREVDKARFGRSRWVALWSAARTLLSHHASLTLQVEDGDGAKAVVRTPTLFVGNNALQLQQIGIDEASAVERGRLAGVLLRELSRTRMLGLMLRGALGRLGAAESVDTFAFRELTVQTGRTGRRRIKLACDGETLWMQTPLTFQVAPHPLRMLLPRQRADRDPG